MLIDRPRHGLRGERVAAPERHAVAERQRPLGQVVVGNQRLGEAGQTSPVAGSKCIRASNMATMRVVTRAAGPTPKSGLRLAGGTLLAIRNVSMFCSGGQSSAALVAASARSPSASVPVAAVAVSSVAVGSVSVGSVAGGCGARSLGRRRLRCPWSGCRVLGGRSSSSPPQLTAISSTAASRPARRVRAAIDRCPIITYPPLGFELPRARPGRSPGPSRTNDKRARRTRPAVVSPDGTIDSGHPATPPPSTGSATPVMNAASSLPRNSAACGLLDRQPPPAHAVLERGPPPRAAGRGLVLRRGTRPVHVEPGQVAFTRMFRSSA